MCPFGPIKPRSQPTRFAATVGLIGVLCLILFVKNMHEPVDHDENQFIASGVLLARHGLLPYRDYPFFHFPYLVYLYAAVFRVCPYLLMGARLVSTVCAVGVVILMCATVYQATAAQTRHAWFIAVGAGLLLISQPAFTKTSGFSWNHDLTELLMLGAAVVVLRGMARGYSTRGLLLAGALMGIATGVRITAAPLLAAMTVLFFHDLRKWTTRPGFKLVAFPLAAAVCLTPAALSFAATPRAFLFGNFRYPALATAWWLGQGSRGTGATPLGKLLFPFTHVLCTPGAIILLLLCACPVCLWIRCRTANVHPYRREVTFLAIACLYLLVGATAPTPLYVHYYYALVPFLILLIAYAMLPLWNAVWVLKPSLKWIGAWTFLIGMLPGLSSYHHVREIFAPSGWTTVRAHRYGLSIRSLQGTTRPVLTLAPLYPLEGGLDIYEFYATGPFSARVAAMLPPEEKCRFHMAPPDELLPILRARTPGSVLVGSEAEDEQPLRDYAAQLHCMDLTLPAPKTAAWQKAIVVVENVK